MMVKPIGISFSKGPPFSGSMFVLGGVFLLVFNVASDQSFVTCCDCIDFAYMRKWTHSWHLFLDMPGFETTYFFCFHPSDCLFSKRPKTSKKAASNPTERIPGNAPKWSLPWFLHRSLTAVRLCFLSYWVEKGALAVKFPEGVVVCFFRNGCFQELVACFWSWLEKKKLMTIFLGDFGDEAAQLNFQQNGFFFREKNGRT